MEAMNVGRVDIPHLPNLGKIIGHLVYDSDRSLQVIVVYLIESVLHSTFGKVAIAALI